MTYTIKLTFASPTYAPKYMHAREFHVALKLATAHIRQFDNRCAEVVSVDSETGNHKRAIVYECDSLNPL